LSITIVPIREEHIEGFHVALDVVSRERRYLTFLEAPPLEQVRGFVSRGAKGEFIQLVALEGERLVGWCDIIIYERATMRHGGSLGIGILPEWRGRGIGAQLIAGALAAARKRRLVRVQLHVRADNERAVRLYQKLGFRHEGRLRRELCIDGAYFDALVMAILLDETDDAEGARA
jgi:ribosomal protein S18 acetylase RimI-like enzyme